VTLPIITPPPSSHKASMVQLLFLDVAMRWQSRRTIYRPAQEPIDPSQFSNTPIGEASHKALSASVTIQDPVPLQSQPMICSSELRRFRSSWTQ
jgi:hypothetical protein